MWRSIALGVTFAALGANALALDQAAKGRAAVLDLLKDPGSAQFRKTYVNGQYFCGEVNAKNSYGGYVGFRRFAAGATAAIEPAEGDPGFEQIWRVSCWPAEKLKAYLKAEKDRSDAFNREVERQREEIKQMNAERDRERAQ